MLKAANLQYEDQDVKQDIKDIKRAVGRPRKDRYPLFVKIGEGPLQRLEGQEFWNFRMSKTKTVRVRLPEISSGAKWRVEIVEGINELSVAPEKHDNTPDVSSNRREVELAFLALPNSIATVLFTLSQGENEVLAQRKISFIK